MGKYSIFYLFNGEARKYQEKLVKEIGPKFGENYVIESKLPAHITLKSPFEIGDIKPVEKVLEEFVKKQKKAKVEIIGFGNFRRFVAFLEFKFSEKAMKIQSEMIKELNKIKEIMMHEYDRVWHPHSTISYGNTPESFDKIWGALMQLEKPKFEIELDNITLMKKGKKYWKIHREFKLK